MGLDRAHRLGHSLSEAVVSYQDVWVKGQTVSLGERECAERYIIIKRFCAQYQRPFTVLDVGANMGYFSLRLAEDFDCTVVAIEPQEGIAKVLEANDNHRVVWLKKALTAADLWTLAQVERFDVVLAFSVLHRLHMDPDEALRALRAMSDYVIVEYPVEAEAVHPEVVASLTIPEDGELLGYGRSHLNGSDARPIVLLRGKGTPWRLRYIGDGRSRPTPVTDRSTFAEKVAVYADGRGERPWLRGINFQTYLLMGGAWPRDSCLVQMLRSAQSGDHGDVRPWNFVLGGDYLALIDEGDPSIQAAYSEDLAWAFTTWAICHQEEYAQEWAHVLGYWDWDRIRERLSAKTSA